MTAVFCTASDRARPGHRCAACPPPRCRCGATTETDCDCDLTPDLYEPSDGEAVDEPAGYWPQLDPEVREPWRTRHGWQETGE